MRNGNKRLPIFSNLVKMAVPSGRILVRVLRKMKACIEEFRPNTSQTNYFEGFWRITSKLNAKIEVRKQTLCFKFAE